jgi:hypothetical protein
MKKFLTVAVAIALAFMMAAPAMATDVSFSGHYRVQGWWADNLSLDQRSADDTVMTHRFRLQTKFDITDMLAVTTRFDAMDGTQWGTTGANATNPGAYQVNWDRNWMTIRTGDWGVFDVGRMAGGAWGTTFIDNVGNADRIKWTYTGIENWTFLLIYQANVEADGGSYAAGANGLTYVTDNQSDQSSDTYHGAFVYKQETWSAGLLYAYTNNKVAPATATRLHSFLPYFTANWGAFNLLGELRWNTGDNDADPSAAGNVDQDIESWAFNLEGDYNFGPATLMLGVAYATGEDADVTNVSAFGGFGADWAYPLYILAGNDNPWTGSLGGVGNLSGANYGGGAVMFYGGLSFNPLENLRLAANFGLSSAEETENINNPVSGIRGDVDDDQGSELDLILDWKIYDNLNYHLVAAWFWAGDYWRDAGGIAEVNFDDAKGIFNQLLISF